MTDKPLTAAKVRAVLRKAGYDCAKSHPSRVRGWSAWSPGFFVREAGGKITAEYRADLPSKERVLAWRERYRVALIAAGMAVADGPFSDLVVTRALAAEALARKEMS
jgi:hypothetical protein